MSLQVCHCRVIFYIPTKFYDDRNLSYIMSYIKKIWWRHDDVTQIWQLSAYLCNIEKP